MYCSRANARTQPDGQINNPVLANFPVCPVLSKKIFRLTRRANHFYNSRRPVPKEGRCATSSTREGMRWTRAALETRTLLFRGRRSRVVLTPRRRRQVGGKKFPPATVTSKPDSPGRSRRKPLKPLRAGMPGDPGGPVVTTLVWFFVFPREATGAMGTRHSPRPHSSGRTVLSKLGRDPRRETRNYVC
jgi:hypothetical protein